jgi:hypothetical protein
MKRRYLILLLLFIICKCHFGQNQAPSFPFIHHDICPGEGCQYGPWIVKSSMKAFINEGDSNALAFVIKPKEKINALRGNVHVIQPGKAIMNKTNDAYSKNDTAYILSYQGEGFFSAWYKGEIINFAEGDPGFTILENAKTEWWVYINNSLGKFGWLRVSENDRSNIEGWNIF